MSLSRRTVLTTAAVAAGASVLGLGSRRALAADKIKIGFSQCTLNHPWRVAQVNVNKAFADQNFKDVDLIITDGNNDSGKQVSDVESLLSQGIKVFDSLAAYRRRSDADCEGGDGQRGVGRHIGSKGQHAGDLPRWRAQSPDRR